MISASRKRQGATRGLLGSFSSVGTLLFLCCIAAEATAQTTDLTVRTAARELATQGADAFERGDYALSYEQLSRAFALYPVPSISIMQARALVHLGRLLEALDRYEETIRMPLEEDAPAAFRAAARDAVVEADEVRSRLPRLVIQLNMDERALKDITIYLDGKTLPSALVGVDCPVDPGEHVVTLRRPQRAPVVRRVQIAEKERLVVELTLPADVSQPSETDQRVYSSSVDSVGNVSTRKWLGMGALGGGAVALLSSAITGKSALNKKDHLDHVCNPGCPVGSQGDIDAFRTYRTVSYITAGVSLSLVGVGGYLLLTGDHTNQRTAVAVSPNGVSWFGRF